MTDQNTLTLENIPLCFSKYIKTKDNILKGNIDKTYYGFKLSNISKTNSTDTFTLELTGGKQDIEVAKYWIFRHLRYLYKTK